MNFDIAQKLYDHIARLNKEKTDETKVRWIIPDETVKAMQLEKMIAEEKDEKRSQK